jgi:hypothetical protein
MTRVASALALIGALSVAAVAAVSASTPAPQAATKTAPTEQPPVTPAKYYRPVKGTATIEVIQNASKRIGGEIVTTLKVKNTSAGRIDLLAYDEYWYDKNLKHVSGSMNKYRKPFNPGDIIELTVKSPVKPDLDRSQILFSHAGGKIEAKAVKKFQ